MTFEQFQATRVWCDDLGKALNDARWEEEPKFGIGYLYLGNLYIEQVQDHWPEEAKARGKWYLLLERSEWIANNLTSLEERLFAWAQSDGYIPADTLESLITEYQDWCRVRGFGPMSADKLFAKLSEEPKYEGDCQWLLHFIRRWEAVEHSERDGKFFARGIKRSEDL